MPLHVFDLEEHQVTSARRFRTPGLCLSSSSCLTGCSKPDLLCGWLVNRAARCYRVARSGHVGWLACPRSNSARKSVGVSIMWCEVPRFGIALGADCNPIFVPAYRRTDAASFGGGSRAREAVWISVAFPFGCVVGRLGCRFLVGVRDRNSTTPSPPWPYSPPPEAPPPTTHNPNPPPTPLPQLPPPAGGVACVASHRRRQQQHPPPLP